MEWQADGTSSEGRHWGAGKRSSTAHLSKDVTQPNGQRRAAHQKLPGEVIGQACLLRQHAHQPDRCVHAHMHLPADTEETRFFVTDAPGPAINGLPSLEAFKIISLNCEIKETVTRPVADKADLIAQYPDC